jgi:hypothetical protein
MIIDDLDLADAILRHAEQSRQLGMSNSLRPEESWRTRRSH